jgi:hypothetical protein
LRAAAPKGGELITTAALAGFVALLGLVGTHRFGDIGLLVPAAVVIGVIVLLRPVLAVSIAVTLAVVCEGPQFGIFTFASKLYISVYGDISLLDLLVALAVAAVALDMVRSRRRLWVPRPLALPLALLALGMVAGAITGYNSGAKLRFALASEHVLAYLLVLPVAVANLDIDRAQVTRLLAGASVLAIFKAVLGLIEVAGHKGVSIEGASTLTYYEPVANWLIMVVLLCLFAAVLTRAKPPLWLLLSSPLLIACLLLSYRRSFWIGAALGVLLVLALGTSPSARRVLVPTILGVVGAIWLLGSINFQSQLPVVKRVTSLTPNRLEANIQDRYRLDERANVLHEIGEHPVTGIGVTIPWRADVAPLGLEHEEGRQYVHFAALWFWLRLGVLGLFAYIGLMVGSLMLAWQVWRRSREPLLRAFGLGSLCAFAGLFAIDTTASFTGVDARFTMLLTAQLGLLALLARTARDPIPRPPESIGPAAG